MHLLHICFTTDDASEYECSLKQWEKNITKFANSSLPKLGNVTVKAATSAPPPWTNAS